MDNATDETYYMYVKNLQGDIVAVADESGSILVEYIYSAYGEFFVEYATTNTELRTILDYSPFRYRGYMYDTESGFYYLNSRYYDPQVGRFVNADSALYHGMWGYNVFVYCNDNPIMFVDPVGKDAILVTQYGTEGLPVVGHTVLLLQDQNGEWWYTEFIGSKPENAHIVTQKLKSWKIQEFSDQAKATAYIGSFKIEGVDFVYLQGNFVKSLAIARYYDKTQRYPDYKVLSNNCAHYVQYLLKYATFSDEGVAASRRLPDSVIPTVYYQRIVFFSILPDNIFSKIPIAAPISIFQ